MQLIDRRAECELLDRMLFDVRSGRSRVLVLHGDPGMGKTTLMDYVAEQASRCRLIRVGGVESEMELAYAALHQLCSPMLDRLERLPPPQRDALATAFGLHAGPAPDRFLIGLAVLSLISDSAEEQPVICLIDDLQWLDNASAQALAFVARRLGAESVGLVLATRVLHPELRALRQVEIRGLPDPDARSLLDTVLTVPLDERVRDLIVAETDGNPLALLQLPRGLANQDLAGGFGFLGAPHLSAAVEESFRREVQALPEGSRRLLQLAAAEPLGNPVLLWRAAATLGISVDAAAPAAAAGLVDFGLRVRFRHPLVRSAVYRSASVRDRQAMHRALAAATDPNLDPDRRAWHRAQATDGPDEDVAADLEHSAARAQARGGLAAAAAFLEQAMKLTPDPAARCERALAAASAKAGAGLLDSAVEMLAAADNGPLTDSAAARADVIRAQLAYITGRGSDAPPLLLNAAQRLEPIDAALARVTYLNALEAAWFAGRLAAGCSIVDVARAAQAAPKPTAPQLPDLILDGFAAHINDGYAAGLPILRRAVSAARDATAADDAPHFLAAVAAAHLWDDEGHDALSARRLHLLRAAGAMTLVPQALSTRAAVHLYAGELAAAETLIEEARTVTRATGDRFAPHAAMRLLALRGDRTALSTFIESHTADAVERGEGYWLTIADLATALLNNGLGDYQAALISARSAAEQRDLVVSMHALVELVEAAVRSGETQTATDAMARLGEMTAASGSQWALGIEARSRALLSDGAQADNLYREAIERLARTRIRTEAARAHLLYAEWLRAERRRSDARTQLRIAYDMFDAMGVHGFARRARRELAAMGEIARERSVTARAPTLTKQEEQIARLARDGLTNSEIGARVFISAKTVQYHLSKVFAKLGISSRADLQHVLPG